MKFKLKTTIIFPFSLLILLNSFTPIKAITSQTLTLAPARQQLEIKPGETSTAILKLINNTDHPTSGTLKAIDFIVSDQNGTPEFIDNQSLSTNYSAASWIKLPFDRLTIPANDKIEIQFKINPPLTALPGGHYTALIFEATSSPSSSSLDNSSQQGASIVAPRIASLIYISVPGNYQESALVTNFQIPKFSQHGPIKISTTLLNQSPIHIKPTGTITITNFLGDVVAQLPLKEANIFPETERVYLNILPTKWLFGRYQARLLISYGTQGKTLEALVYFTVFPLTLCLYLLIFITACLFTIRTLIKRSRHHHQELEKQVANIKHQLEQLKD